VVFLGLPQGECEPWGEAEEERASCLWGKGKKSNKKSNYVLTIQLNSCILVLTQKTTNWL